MLSPLGTRLEEEEVAQEVFHQTLLPDLVQHGASSLAEIEKRGLKFFRLKMKPEEIQDILELARRRRLVKPVGNSHNAYEKPIGQTEWMPTKRGRELERPRGLTFAAFREYVMEVSPAGQKVAQIVQWLVVTALTLPIVGSLLGKSPVTGGADSSVKTGLIVAAAVVVVLLAVVLYMGMVGDARLRRAARSWVRLKEEWPNFYAWQVNPVRPWLGLLGVLLVISPFAFRLIGREKHLWLEVPYFLGILVIAGVGVKQWRATSEREGAAKQKSGANLTGVASQAPLEAKPD